METKMEKVAEVRDGKGEPIWSVWLSLDQIGFVQGKAQNHEGGKNNGKKGGQGANGDLMTDAQKRYLFRLLSDRGIEGEAAYDHLKKTFSVESLKDISKYDASREIDRMVNG